MKVLNNIDTIRRIRVFPHTCSLKTKESSMVKRENCQEEKKTKPKKAVRHKDWAITANAFIVNAFQMESVGGEIKNSGLQKKKWLMSTSNNWIRRKRIERIIPLRECAFVRLSILEVFENVTRFLKHTEMGRMYYQNAEFTPKTWLNKVSAVF